MYISITQYMLVNTSISFPVSTEVLVKHCNVILRSTKAQWYAREVNPEYKNSPFHLHKKQKSCVLLLAITILNPRFI